MTDGAAAEDDLPLARSADQIEDLPSPLEPAHPAESATVIGEPPAAIAPAITLVSTRRLLGASFDLLSRSGEDMRRASFYVGAVVLGTAGPLAVGSWVTAVAAVDRPPAEMESLLAGLGGVLLAVLGAIAAAGLVVAIVESRILGVAVLGGRMAGRPVTTRQALARSRRSFWRAIAAAIVASIPLGVVQAGVTALLEPILLEAADLSLVVTTAVTALVGAPFAYMLAGVVLGDVGPFESMRRSFRLFRARKAAAVIVVVFETVAAVLVFLGLSAGLDVALRLFDALGLGADAGPAGLALTTIGIVAVVFAFGTLVYTVMALTVAPQVVMFVGLTHATPGLDRVAAGGPDDPDAARSPHGRFRWFTAPMALAAVAGVLAVAGMVVTFAV